MKDKLLELYESLDSFEKIIAFSDNLSVGDSDGENHTFELKGSDGLDTLDKNLKTYLSKEFSGFANTYGGILIYHKGNRNTIEAFPNSSDFKSIEGWIRDSLRPHLYISVKYVKGVSEEGVYVFLIPESKIKPHQSIDDKYYHRINTSTNPMPEIMIRALCKAQDIISTDMHIILSYENGQSCLSLNLENTSQVAGEKGFIKIYILSNKISKQVGIYESPDKHFFSGENSWVDKIYKAGNINCVLSSSKEYREFILYPYEQKGIYTILGIKNSGSDRCGVVIERAFVNGKKSRKFFSFDENDLMQKRELNLEGEYIDFSNNGTEKIIELLGKFK